MVRGISNLLLWCNEHKIEIDGRLEIRGSLLDGSMSVFSKSDAAIVIGETCMFSLVSDCEDYLRELFEVVRIPKSSVFSVKNCSRSRDIPAAAGDDAALELSLAFLLETQVNAILFYLLES